MVSPSEIRQNTRLFCSRIFMASASPVAMAVHDLKTLLLLQHQQVLTQGDVLQANHHLYYIVPATQEGKPLAASAAYNAIAA